MKKYIGTKKRVIWVLSLILAIGAQSATASPLEDAWTSVKEVSKILYLKTQEAVEAMAQFLERGVKRAGAFWRTLVQPNQESRNSFDFRKAAYTKIDENSSHDDLIKYQQQLIHNTRKANELTQEQKDEVSKKYAELSELRKQKTKEQFSLLLVKSKPDTSEKSDEIKRLENALDQLIADHNKNGLRDRELNSLLYPKNFKDPDTMTAEEKIKRSALLEERYELIELDKQYQENRRKVEEELDAAMLKTAMAKADMMEEKQKQGAIFPVSMEEDRLGRINQETNSKQKQDRFGD